MHQFIQPLNHTSPINSFSICVTLSVHSSIQQPTYTLSYYIPQLFHWCIFLRQSLHCSLHHHCLYSPVHSSINNLWIPPFSTVFISHLIPPRTTLVLVLFKVTNKCDLGPPQLPWPGPSSLERTFQLEKYSGQSQQAFDISLTFPSSPLHSLYIHLLVNSMMALHKSSDFFLFLFFFLTMERLGST